MTKYAKIIRQRRRLLTPPKTSARADDLTDTKMNDRSERVNGKISKYNNNDESRR